MWISTFQLIKHNFIQITSLKLVLFTNFSMQNILHKPYIDQIIYRLTEARHNLNSNSNIITNHLIFNLAFKTFWKHYRIGRGCVYTFTTPFKECEVLSYLTGIIYWCFHRGIVEWFITIPPLFIILLSLWWYL